MEWTLATPIIDRELAISFYLESLNRVRLPRQDIHLLFVDLSNNPKIRTMLEKFIKRTKHDWKSVTVKSPTFTTYKSYKNDTHSDFLERRVAIADTMDYINKHRKGNLIIWEEDIYVPENAFESCVKYLELETITAVAACQYSRRLGWPDKLMAWDWEKKSTFGEHDRSKEVKWELTPIRHEYCRGFCTVDATATGFILIREEFLDGYKFDGKTDGQDVMLGRHINGLDSDIDTGKHLLLNWNVKTVHIGEDERGALKFFKSDKCKTEVIKDGIRYA